MSEVEKTDNEQKDMEAILTEARFKFAMKSLAKIVSLKKEKTWFFSPLTIFEILCTIYIGSESTEDVESIEENLEQILHLSDVSKANLTQYYSQQEFSCQKDSTNLHKDESSCWITNSKVLSDTVQHLYRGKMETVDFSTESSSDLLNRINSSLSNMMMPVELSNITESMEIILLSALYSSLEYISIQANTKRKFRTLRATNMIMNEIPYNDNLSIFLLFPTGKDQTTGHLGICSDVMLLVLTLTTEEGMAELREMLDSDESNPNESIMIKTDELDVRLLNDIPIEELLKFLNVGKLMESNEAILHRFVAKDEQLHLGDAIHRAYITLSSGEIVAKAVTIFFTKNGGSFKPKVEMNIKQTDDQDTFVFLIYDKNNRKILFIGVVNDDISDYQNLETSVDNGSIFDYEDKSEYEDEYEYECKECDCGDKCKYKYESPNSKKGSGDIL